MENLNKAIQWYPGHMAKARRQMGENIKRIDAVLEVVDARIPYSSSNPDFEGMFQSKMRLAVLNKSDMADNSVTQKVAPVLSGQKHTCTGYKRHKTKAKRKNL